jgi:hypothetical protein
MKEKFLVALDKPESDFIKKQAPIFGSHSRVIRIALRVVMELISQNKIAWSAEELHALLSGNKRNPMSADSGSPGRRDGSAADTSPRYETYFLTTPRRAGANLVRAWDSPFCGTRSLALENVTL